MTGHVTALAVGGVCCWRHLTRGGPSQVCSPYLFQLYTLWLSGTGAADHMVSHGKDAGLVIRPALFALSQNGSGHMVTHSKDGGEVL